MHHDALKEQGSSVPVYELGNVFVASDLAWGASLGVRALIFKSFESGRHGEFVGTSFGQSR